MVRYSRTWIGAAALGVALILAGCESQPVPSSNPFPTDIAWRDAKMFGVVWIEHLGAKKKSPASLKDLEAKKERLGNLYDQIQNGEFVVIWKAALTLDGANNDKQVIGYEKKTPTEGGTVVFGGGTVKRLTPELFKKQQLAKGAK
jgi:hypothetical protein